MRSTEQDQICLLCGEVADLVGVFAPGDSQQYGAAPGKQRYIFYSICSDCCSRDDLQAVEHAIARQLHRERAA